MLLVKRVMVFPMVNFSYLMSFPEVWCCIQRIWFSWKKERKKERKGGVYFAVSDQDHPVTKLLQSPFKATKGTATLVGLGYMPMSGIYAQVEWYWLPCGWDEKIQSPDCTGYTVCVVDFCTRRVVVDCIGLSMFCSVKGSYDCKMCPPSRGCWMLLHTLYVINFKSFQKLNHATIRTIHLLNSSCRLYWFKYVLFSKGFLWL